MERKSFFVQEIFTECEIDAPADRIYSIISNFENYASWTSEMTVTGSPAIGGKMAVKVKTANKGNGWYTLSSKMQQNDRRMIAFDNVLLASFLFFGRHRFEIIPVLDNRTMFVNAEVFSGLLVPFIRKNNLQKTTRTFKENLNRSLKRTAEVPSLDAV